MAMKIGNPQLSMTAWVLSTDKKILSNTIKHRVDSVLQKQKYSLEERRERLRDLISTEDEEYMSEMVSRQETPLEKQAKMRERARSLRERREGERLAIVEEKLDQRWRDQCEELRGIEVKRHQEDIARQRFEQLRLKDEEWKRKQEEEILYAKMWSEDHLVKSQREEVEAALQIERNKEMLDLLNMQTAAREKERDNLRKLREKEAELLREQAALRAMEEERQKQEKRQKQEESRACLEYSLKLKMKKKAKDVQEELALDMKILEQMLKDTTNEAMENLQRKNQLKEEVGRYRQYLEEQAKEECKREKELDAIVTAEVERQWSKRAQQWKQEKQARGHLMQHVMNTRKYQLEERIAEVARQKAEAEDERNKLIQEFKEHQQQEKQQEEEKRQVALSYQTDLLEQMKYLDLTKKMEQQRLEEELALQKEAEALYKRRIKDALDKLDSNKTRVNTKGLSLFGHAI